MRKILVLSFVISAFFASRVMAQGDTFYDACHIEKLAQKPPGFTARITDAIVLPSASPFFDTGNLRIIFSDGTIIFSDGTIILEILPDQTEQAGFGDVKIADDQRTVGWRLTSRWSLAQTANTVQLRVYRSGRRIVCIDGYGGLWYWMFRDGGNQVVTVSGPGHGTLIGDFELWDTNTGKKLGGVKLDTEAPLPRRGVPAWAAEMYRYNAAVDKRVLHGD